MSRATTSKTRSIHASRLTRWLPLGGTALALTLLLAPSALADHSAVMQSAHSGKCLDVAGGSSSSGADVEQQTCDQGASQTLNFCCLFLR